MDYLVDPFCDLDVIPAWEKSLLADGAQKRRRASRMIPSEMMTIIAFVQRYWHFYFPNLLSYTRFMN